MKKVLVSVAMATMFTSTVLACDPVATGGYTVNYTTNNIVNNYGVNYGSMDIYSNSGSGYQEINSCAYCGICGLTWDACTCYDGGCTGSGYVGYDRTGDTYYDSQGHLCEYGGYWESGQWITTVGYYEGGVWYPAEYDPALEVGYYDECGQYHSYYSGCSTSNLSYGWNRGGYVTGYGYSEESWDGCTQQVYDESCTWACDNAQWLDTQDDEWTWCGDYEYQENSGYYEDCNVNYDGYWIDVDVNADTINLVNNGVIVLSGSCSCATIYGGQELSFDSQRCAGIWNTCSEGFYSQACEYVTGNCPVMCH